MKLYCVNMELPFPLNNGGSVAMYNRLQGLSGKGHAIDLLCATKRQHERTSIAAVARYCNNVNTFYVGRFAALRNVLRMPTLPLRSTTRFHKALQAHLDDLVLSDDGDALIIDHSPMAVYARPVYRRYLKVVLVVHALVHKSLTRIANELPVGHPKRLSFRLEALLSRRFENSIFGGSLFDEYWFYSEHDRREVIGQHPDVASRSCTLPLGVTMRKPVSSDGNARGPLCNEILLVGSMDNVSNEDAARWFANEIFPLVRREVPHAQFVIVGRNSSHRLADLKSDGVRVIGEVSDLSPFIQRCGVFVVPQRGGAGIRVKLLDGLAAQKVVVSTSVGTEAMPGLIAGSQYLLADEAAQFADHVINVLRKPERFGDVARRGFEFARANYSVEAAASAAEERLLHLCNIDGLHHAAGD